MALVTGAARGQGRSHAIELAKEGADILAIDICEDLDMAYPPATEEDLQETVRAVEAGVAELGRLDIAIAGIGSAPFATTELPAETWRTMLDINLTGVWLTAKAATPHLLAGGRGGSIVVISSVAGIRPLANIAHYAAARAGGLQLTKSLAAELGPHGIRVNSIYPTNVKTNMILNDTMYKLFRPDLESPTLADFEAAATTTHALPIPYVEAIDVSNAVLFLVSETGRYITGVSLPVDGGMVIK